MFSARESPVMEVNRLRGRRRASTANGYLTRETWPFGVTIGARHEPVRRALRAPARALMQTAENAGPRVRPEAKRSRGSGDSFPIK
jgi:hypothetical protein